MVWKLVFNFLYLLWCSEQVSKSSEKDRMDQDNKMVLLDAEMLFLDFDL